MNNCRILYIIRQADFGGGETHLKYIFDLIDRRVFTPVLVSFKAGFLSEHAQSSGIKFYLLSDKSLGLIKNIIKLITIIRKERIDFIHSHGTKGAAIALIPSILKRKKFIYTVHGWSFHKELNKLQFAFRKFIERIICAFAELVIFVSEADFTAGSFVSSSKKIVVKNGVDISKFSPSKNCALKSELGYDINDFVIGYFARFTLQKNPLFVIRLLKYLAGDKAGSQKKFKLLMAGSGEMRNGILKEIKSQNLEELVKVLEPTNEIEKFFKIIDCYILPSLWEGLPYGVLEAMAAGIPVIASNIPALREVIKSGKNGFCEELDLYKFRKRILQLAHNPELHKKISSNARKTIEEKFDINTKMSEIFRTYERIINQ